MLKKSWKIRARTGGIRRKIAKEYARIISLYDEKNNEREIDSYKESASCNAEGSAPYNNSMSGFMNIQNEILVNDAGCLNIEGNCKNNKQANNDSLSRLEPEVQAPDSSEDSEDDNDAKFSSFREKIRSWAIEKNINQTALKDLAKIVNELIPQLLPNDPRTILKTPRYINVKQIEGGEYWHNGISNTLTELLEKWDDVPDHIFLNFNFDGLPIFKSSKKEFWPILCSIHKRPDIKPFVIGIYYGEGKPKNLDAYLEDFIIDVTNLLEKGISLQQQPDKPIIVKIRCFICDSPARAYIKGTHICRNTHYIILTKQK